MIKETLMVSAMAMALLIFSQLAFSADQSPVGEKIQAQIYGSQLMTQQEREEHQAKMRAGKTAEEREQIRNEHHRLMTERAKAQGLSLPDEPPARGREGMGFGGGMGPGGGGGRR